MSANLLFSPFICGIPYNASPNKSILMVVPLRLEMCLLMPFPIQGQSCKKMTREAGGGSV